MKYSILFGGKAGQGTNFLAGLLSKVLVKKGFYVFNSKDFPSLIRGGHNFNVLTFSDSPIYSNERKIDVIVALDNFTSQKHKPNLNKEGLILEGKFSSMYFAGMIFQSLGLEFNLLKDELKKFSRFKQNLEEASKGYKSKTSHIKLPKVLKKNLKIANGSEAVGDGAIKAGLDIYFAYPMSPSTALLMHLAGKQKEKKILVLELENEIAIANAGVGASITGAKTMVGTSGGGFALMSEALSMAGVAGAPLVFYLAQRKGPASGVATYQEQGELLFSRGSGHGEFARIIIAPGDAIECEEVASQAIYLSQKFSNPSIILSDRHIAESFYTSNLKPRIAKSGKLVNFARYNSYEKNPETGSATEEASIIKSNVEERLEKMKGLLKESSKFDMFKIHGKKNSKNCIVFWGSPKGAVLDTIKGLDVCALQVLYIEPFSEKIEKILKKKKNLILVENNATGQLGNLIREKTGIEIKKRILKYDGRPFLSDELNKEIRKYLK